MHRVTEILLNNLNYEYKYFHIPSSRLLTALPGLSRQPSRIQASNFKLLEQPRKIPTGSCSCGTIKISYTGSPVRTALCHCSNCRHYTGSLFSINYVIPFEIFKILTGNEKLKETSVITDSGKSITNTSYSYCAGAMLYRYGDTFGGKEGMRIIQAGILDEWEVLDKTKVDLEMFITGRVCWIKSVWG
ncbi:hypothetical protein BDZ45DRAFT_587153, partial [Acephala macrosclerotiorum]